MRPQVVMELRPCRAGTGQRHTDAGRRFVACVRQQTGDHASA